MALQNIQRIAPFNGKGKNYREILDLAKEGKTPISVELYNENRNTIWQRKQRESTTERLMNYLPAASDLHGSYAPQGATFKEANRKYGSRYDGYHVSEDSQTKEKILFPLAKKLPDESGREITVGNAKDRIILVRIKFVDGKPTIEYEYDAHRKETRLHLNTSDVSCVKFPTKEGSYEFKNGIFARSDDSNANNLYRADGVSWNGFFSLGADLKGLGAYLRPCCHIGMLIEIASESHY